MPTYTIQNPRGGKPLKVKVDQELTDDQIDEIAANEFGSATPEKGKMQQIQDEEKLAREEIISREQRPFITKASEMAMMGPKMVGGILKTGYEGLKASPELLSQPERILPTAAEATRRIGMDVVELPRQLLKSQAKRIVSGRLPSLSGTIIDSLRSRTPTEREIALELAMRPTEEAIQEERQAVRFEGAQPEVAEAGAQIGPMVAPFMPKFLKSAGKKISGKPTITGAASEGAIPPVLGESKPPVLSNEGMVDKVKSGLNKKGLYSKPSDLYADVINPTTEMELADLGRRAKVGTIDRMLEKVKAQGGAKTGESFDSAIDAGKRAKISEGEKIQKFSKDFPDEKVTLSDVSSEANQMISKEEIIAKRNPQAIEKLKEVAKEYDRNFTTNEALEKLNELNRRRSSYYRKSQNGQATDLDDLENRIDQLARDRLSDKFDGLIRNKTGIDENPFRDYGQIGQFVDDVTLRKDVLRGLRMKQVGKGIGPTGIVQGSPRSGLAEMFRKGADLFLGGEEARVMSNLKKMFNRVKVGGPARQLSPIERDLLLKKLTTDPKAENPPYGSATLTGD